MKLWRARPNRTFALMASATGFTHAADGAMRFLCRPKGSRTPEERLNAVRNLPTAPDSIPALLDALDDPSPDIVKAALSTLASVAGPTETAVLRERLLAVDLAVLRDWAAALREIGDARASVAVGVGGLQAEQTGTRIAAAVCLGELQDAAAVTPLLEALGDSIAGVRRNALLSLATLRGPADIRQPCARMLFDADDGVRAAAVDALVCVSVWLDSDLRPAVDDPSLRVRRRVGGYAAALRPETVSRLLADLSADVRAATAWSLARHSRPDLARTLLAHLSDPAWEVRRALCHAIATTGDLRATADLIPRLADEHPTVRAAALNVLADMPGNELAGAIRRSLPGAPGRLRRVLIYALVRCPEDLSVPILTSGATDPDPEVRLAVAHVAGDITHPHCGDMLAVLATDFDPAVKRAAVAARARRRESRE